MKTPKGLRGRKCGSRIETNPKYYIIIIIFTLCRAAGLLKRALQGGYAFYMRKMTTVPVSLALLFAAAPLFAQSSPAAAPALSAAQVRERAALLRDNDVKVRIAAARELGRAGTPAARRALVTELGREKNPHIRARIVEAIGARPDKDGVAELIRIAERDQDADARQAAVRALAFAKDDAAAAALMRIFADADEAVGVRLLAADSLTLYPTDAVFSAFTAALDDADGRIRTQAVVSLYNAFAYDKPRVRPHLERMTVDAEAGETARIYLERLGS